MNLFKDLFGYKKAKIYDSAKKRKDARFNLGYDYGKEGLLSKMVSPFILRSQTLRQFIVFIDDYIYNITNGIRYVKNYKNFTTKKDDKQVR